VLRTRRDYPIEGNTINIVSAVEDISTTIKGDILPLNELGSNLGNPTHHFQVVYTEDLSPISGIIVMTDNLLNSLADPVSDQDAATKNKNNCTNH